MNYENEIIKLLKKIKTEQILRYIYIFIKDIVDEIK